MTVEERKEANRLRVNAWRSRNRERVRQASKTKWATDPAYRS